MAMRMLGACLGLILIAPVAWAQTHTLSESPKAGDCLRYDISTSVKGELRINKDGKTVALPLAAGTRHQFVERVLEAKEKGPLVKVARHYEFARSNMSVDGVVSSKDLRAERRLAVAQRGGDKFLCYCPAGPLTRDELELVSEHFDTLALTGLLPEKEVKVGESWKLGNEVTLALCLFEGLISHDLTARLEELADGFAHISLAGKAQGIELGAMTKLTIVAKLRFDLLRKKLVSLEWTQKDERDQGPANPASTVEATTTIKRASVETPKELSENALESVPKGADVPVPLTLVYYRDAKGRYDIAVTREWVPVAQTDDHLVLRLVDRGELVAQVSLTAWTKAEPGKHMDPMEFKRVMAETPGWQLEEILDTEEVPAEAGRWMYRVVARGQMDDLKVVQNFYIIAGPNGDQTVATFTLKPGQTAKLGSRDLTLVGAIGFPTKK